MILTMNRIRPCPSGMNSQAHLRERRSVVIEMFPISFCERTIWLILADVALALDKGIIFGAFPLDALPNEPVPAVARVGVYVIELD
jgi:hypothetical protein